MHKKLYVGNLDDDTTEADLLDFFSLYGTVITITIKKNSVTGEPSGCGFVLVETHDPASPALDESPATSAA